MPSDWKGAFSRRLQRQKSDLAKRLANIRWTKDRERRNRVAKLEAERNPTRIAARIVVIVDERKLKEFTMWSFETWRERQRKCRKAESFALTDCHTEQTKGL